MRQIQDSLVIGVGVNSGHQTAFNTEFVQQYFGERSQAVGGAGSVGNDVVFCRIIFFFVNTHNDGDVFAFCRSGDDYLFNSVMQMSCSLGSFGEAAGGFYNNFSTCFAPRNLCRIQASKYFDFAIVNNNVVTFDANFMIESAVDRVIFQQVSQSGDVARIVDSNNLYFRIVECYTENLAADTAKTINTYFCHNNFLLNSERI